MEYRYTLFVYHNDEWTPVADGDTVMDMTMFMTEIQLAGYKASEMYVIDTTTGEMVMTGPIFTA